MEQLDRLDDRRRISITAPVEYSSSDRYRPALNESTRWCPLCRYQILSGDMVYITSSVFWGGTSLTHAICKHNAERADV